jgi:hypothetical protein
MKDSYPMPYHPQAAIARLCDFPIELEALISPLTDAQLDHKMPGEWTTRQIVHHLADSHMSAVFRFKLPLTEPTPTFMTYDQDAFAELADYQLPIESSIIVIRGLHARFAALLESLTNEQWEKTGIHPNWGEVTVAEVASRYADHCDAHIEQITRVLAYRA